MSKAAEKARDIEVLVLDVDGVLSNGLLIYSDNGEETKTFHPADGLGIKLLQSQGIAVAIITGRLSRIVERRAAALGMTPADADPFVIEHADWCSQRPGGRGAVREACEFILDARGQLAGLRQRFLEGAGL